MNTNRTVAIADDDPAILDSLRLVLEIDGYHVKTAEGGDQIPAMIKSKPDVLLLDIWMAGQDGRDICRMIKADKATADIPVILISAGRDMLVSAMAAGADEFMAKPLEMEDLLKKIKKITEKTKHMDTEKTTNLRRFSHDLRNTLSVIFNYTQVLEMSLQKSGTEKDIEITKHIIESIKKMDALITEELDGENS